ncbi:MAG: metal-binding protein [Actinomycetota bacterium]
MPSGRTHDRITLWSLPFVAGLTFGQTQSGNLTLIISGGFLFGGLMFGPDLDIYSRQYQRWGWLRWIWLPYQSSLRHRSFLSHGPLIGTALRLVYLATWIALLAMLASLMTQLFGGVAWNADAATLAVVRSLAQHQTECFALYIGLELGAMSHSLSDWSGSAYKRWRKKLGISDLGRPPAKIKKRQRKSPSRTPGKSKL